jgi:catalase (peroxidase I)
VGTVVGQCAWEAVYSANSLRCKPSSGASTFWRLALVPYDDWEADSPAVTNRSLKALRKMNRSFKFLCNFLFLGPICKRTGVIH